MCYAKTEPCYAPGTYRLCSSCIRCLRRVEKPLAHMNLHQVIIQQTRQGQKPPDGGWASGTKVVVQIVLAPGCPLSGGRGLPQTP